ncbi:type II toxin-antitoxin system VapC family toxin [Parafilimonas sp.]|uniref:type II toxin-antitoxin system VapC family toxin n=1 Tax=Parafilimonas sp. TaxID=1969739 RepID=UPI0039E64447
MLKLYHRETGTSEIENLFSGFEIEIIFISEITRVEFYSAVWKKVRSLEISETAAVNTLRLYESDFEKYVFVITSPSIIEQAKNFVNK